MDDWDYNWAKKIEAANSGRVPATTKVESRKRLIRFTPLRAASLRSSSQTLCVCLRLGPYTKQVPCHIIRPNASMHGPPTSSTVPGQSSHLASGIFATSAVKGLGGLLRFSRRIPDIERDARLSRAMCVQALRMVRCMASVKTNKSDQSKAAWR